MSALLELPLNLDVGVDFALLVTILGSNGAQVAFPGLVAELAVRVSPLDASPLFTLTTTPGPTGSLALGVAPPAPTGANCTILPELEALGAPFTLSTSPPAPIVATVATLTALATQPTTGFSVGEVALVEASAGALYQWSPADPLTPNGTTIVAGVSGNWLLAATVGIVVTAAAAALLAGSDQGVYDLVLTWTAGTTFKLLSGPVTVQPTEVP